VLCSINFLAWGQVGGTEKSHSAMFIISSTDPIGVLPGGNLSENSFPPTLLSASSSYEPDLVNRAICENTGKCPMIRIPLLPCES